MHYQLEEKRRLVGLEGGLGVHKRDRTADIILCRECWGRRELLDELHGMRLASGTIQRVPGAPVCIGNAVAIQGEQEGLASGVLSCSWPGLSANRASGGG